MEELASSALVLFLEIDDGFAVVAGPVGQDLDRLDQSQLVVVSSNQTGAAGGMRFLGQAKVVGPAGNILARTWGKAGLAVAELDVSAEIAAARLVLSHLDELRPETYRL